MIRIVFCVVAVSLYMVSQSVEAQITTGDVIVIDFGKTGQETSGNWNNIANSGANGENTFGIGEEPVVLAEDLIRFADGAATGVSLDVQANANNNVGIGGAEVVSVGASASFESIGVIDDSAQIDVLFVNHVSVELTISGLDDGLSYEVELMSNINAVRNAQEIGVGGLELLVDPNGTTYVTAFDNVTTDGEGNLVITFTAPNGGANLQHINALSLAVSSEGLVLGDVDQSGTVDFFDISPFIAILSSGTFLAEADIDLSGTVDFSDINPFILILSGE